MVPRDDVDDADANVTGHGRLRAYDKWMSFYFEVGVCIHLSLKCHHQQEGHGGGVGTFRNRWGREGQQPLEITLHLNWARKESLILALETTTLTLSTL